MKTSTDLVARARRVSIATYDRGAIEAELAAHIGSWQLPGWAYPARLTRITRATLDIVEALPGATLAQRWAAFETEVWPRWQAGQGRLPRWPDWWAVGVWVLVLARLVQPGWPVVSGFRVRSWTEFLPGTDPILNVRSALAEASGTWVVGTPPIRARAVDLAVKLMLVRGLDRLDGLTDDDLLLPPAGYKGCDILDALLCQLGVLDRTPRRGIGRRRATPRHSERELVAISGIPQPFTETVALYLEAYARRLSDVYATLRHKCIALGHFFRYIAANHPEVTSCAAITPAQARGFVPHALELARTVQRATDRYGTSDRTTPYAWMIDVRTFFADLSTWAAEPGSPLAGHAPSAVILARHDLLDAGFTKARKQQRARLTETVLELQREIPNIRAFALRRWHDAEQALTGDTTDRGLIAAERGTFWDWALLELLLTSGLRIEEALELTTLDILKRSLPNGDIYYLLHVKPSKFGRARVIPIGNQLGTVLAEIIRHVKGFYNADQVPFIDRRDAHEKRPLPRAPYLLQALRTPIVFTATTVRGRLSWIAAHAGATRADGNPLNLTPHDCRRLFASEHLNAHTPVHVIQALLGHATIDTVMVYAKLYPDELVNEYRRAMRGMYLDVHGDETAITPTAADWHQLALTHSLRDMGTHICVLPAGEHCPRGLVCLGCGNVQPKRGALDTFRVMLASHTKALDDARRHHEPEGQLAARELEIDRIRSIIRRAELLDADAAQALEAAAQPTARQTGHTTENRAQSSPGAQPRIS